jgi:hypothetical protein
MQRSYCPKLQVNTIGHVQTGQGYQLYTTNPYTFTVQGSPIDYVNTPLALLSGWNMIAYLPPVSDSVWHAAASIQSSLVIIKDEAGAVYWPALSVDRIHILQPGSGYKILLSSDVSFTYPTPQSMLSKLGAGSGHATLLSLPSPQHFTTQTYRTGNNATALVQSVLADGHTVADGSEIAAYDTKGNLVGSGTVVNGRTAFAVWGDDPMTKGKDGCVGSEQISFKLWNETSEYPLEFVSTGITGSKSAVYSEDGVFLGKFVVPDGALIKKFELSKVYPNPFKGQVKIAFDVPTLNNVSRHYIEINVYDLRGCLVHQVAKGIYEAGHYNVVWNSSATGNRVSDNLAPSVYIVRMKAANFDKRLKLIRVR